MFKSKAKDTGGSSKPIYEDEYVLLDIVIADSKLLKISIVYKNLKTSKVTVTKPSKSTTTPFLSNAPSSWLIPTLINTNSDTNNIEVIEAIFTEKRATRFSSLQSIISANFLNPKSLSTLDEFTLHQTNFVLQNDERNAAIKEVVKNSLNYELHFPWNKIDIISDPSSNTFIMKKKKSPAPPPNPLAPLDNSNSEQNSQDSHSISSSDHNDYTTSDLSQTDPILIPESNSPTSTIRPSSPISINDISMTIDHQEIEMITEDSYNRFEQSLQNDTTNQNNQTNWTEYPDPNLASSSSPIHINHQSDLTTLCSKLEDCKNNPTDLANLLYDIKKSPRITPNQPTKAIFSKIQYRDRSFFKNFTKNQYIRCQHQIEYESIEKTFHDNYKKDINVSYLNRTAKKKARIIIN